MPQDDPTDDLVQAVKPVHKNNLSPITPAAISHITVHHDTSSGKSIVLWDDVLQVFKDALYVRHGTRILSFIKGTDFKNLEPLRFAAIPDAILNIVVDGQFTSTDPAPPQDLIKNLASHIDLNALQEKGEGDAHDFLKALGCYLKAVRQGHTRAQISVGDLFAHGQGVQRDLSRACQWFLLAANQGDVEAQSKIARIKSDAPGTFPEAPPQCTFREQSIIDLTLDGSEAQVTLRDAGGNVGGGFLTSAEQGDA
ncbi:hypothetical protein BGX23_002376 [Mortierella sp. AD031]|nr:hypothetical protein BGX23_002376 [Mortierella sp. AD031]